MTEALLILASASFWVATVRIATPLVFGTLGELVCERAGIVNLAIEGIMVGGALSAWLVAYATGNLWLAIAAAFVVGVVLGLGHGFLTAVLGLSQHVSGIAGTLLATALSYFIYRMIFPTMATPPKIEPFAVVEIPLLAKIPVLGPALFAQTPFTYLAYATIAIVAYGLFRTPLGLAVRGAGENPSAVEAQGISVLGIRVAAVAFGSGLMALGGAFITSSAFDSFYFNMINGRGWICIALVVFASWRPSRVVFGALLFAGLDAYQLRLQQIFSNAMPYQVFLMLPYLLAILALALTARRSEVPRALLLPFRKGER
jgi:simple sugar transport system permease protein